jgi:hypothetical protein
LSRHPIEQTDGERLFGAEQAIAGIGSQTITGRSAESSGILK